MKNQGFAIQDDNKKVKHGGLFLDVNCDDALVATSFESSLSTSSNNNRPVPVPSYYAPAKEVATITMVEEATVTEASAEEVAVITTVPKLSIKRKRYCPLKKDNLLMMAAEAAAAATTQNNNNTKNNALLNPPHFLGRGKRTPSKTAVAKSAAKKFMKKTIKAKAATPLAPKAHRVKFNIESVPMVQLKTQV